MYSCFDFTIQMFGSLLVMQGISDKRVLVSGDDKSGLVLPDIALCIPATCTSGSERNLIRFWLSKGRRMNNGSNAKLPMLAVIAVVVFQFLVAALGLILFARGLRIEMAEYSAEYTHPPDAWYAFGGLLTTIVVCAVSATGLLMRQRWARWLTLILATVPLCAVVVEKAIYKRHPGFDFTPALLGYAIWALVPISLWWWLVFTRKRVKAQFGSSPLPQLNKTEFKTMGGAPNNPQH
jgi:lysylphosphatidylglycerol synthetase-like protein (DUF2156 family)